MHANVGRLHLKLGGMHCSLCVESVRRAVLRLPGVRSVHVSIAHEEVLVEYDPGRVVGVPGCGVNSGAFPGVLTGRATGGFPSG
jgi:cation transport ATPase